MPQSLMELPLDQLLFYLADRQVTGTLTVEVSHARKKLYLLDGLLAGVSSSNPRELLGHFLVGWGLVREEQVAEAMRLQEQLGTPLGRILERMGAIDPDDLAQALVAQSEEAVLELFLAPRVENQQLAENIVPIDRPLVLRRPLPPLVLEGLRRQTLHREIRALVPSDQAIPQRFDTPLPEGLSTRDRLILAAMDGTSTVAQLALTCHLVPFHVLELVFRGIQMGFVAIRDVGAPPPEASVAALLQRGRDALGQGDLVTVWQAVGRLRAQAPAEAANLTREVEGRLAPLRLASHFVPRLANPPSSLPAGIVAEAAFVLSRVTGGWNLKEIHRLTPLEEVHFWVVIETLVKIGALVIEPPSKRTTPATPQSPGTVLR